MVRKPMQLIRLPVPYPVRKLKSSLIVDGTEVKSDAIRMTYTDMVTTGTSFVEAVLRNDGTYSDLWAGGEKVELYADFVNGTTQKFEGYLIAPDPIMTKFPQVKIFAQDYGVEAQRLKITRAPGTETDIGEIAKSLITDKQAEGYLVGHTTNNINVNTGFTANPSWSGVPLWQCIKDLALKYGRNQYDFNCDFSKDWNFFKKGSRLSDAYPVFYGGNIRTVPKVNDGIRKKINSVVVHGAKQEGVPVYASAEDIPDQKNIFAMDDIIRNTGLTTYDQCKSEADTILAVKKLTGKNGTVVINGEIGMQAGFKYFFSHPFIPLHGYYVVSEIKHVVMGTYSSSLKFYEVLPLRSGSIAIFERIKEREDMERDIENKYDMKDTITETFETDISGTYTNVEVSSSRLVLQSGKTTGTWISPTLDLDYNAKSVHLLVNGSNYEISEIYASSDSGKEGTWELVQPNEKGNLTTKLNGLRLKIDLKSDANHLNPSIESVSLGCR